MQISSFLVLLFSIGIAAQSLQDTIAARDTENAVNQIKGGAYLGPIAGKNSMTALHLAAYKGDFKVCQEILKKSKDTINKFVIDSTGNIPMKRTPLLYALHGFHELNHQPNSPNSQQHAEEYKEIIKLLIKQGAKPFQRDEHGRNSLHLALQFGLTSVVPHTASSKTCSALAGTGSSGKSDQNYLNWNIFHFAGYSRFRWKMISNLLLKEEKYDFEHFKNYFGNIWSREYLSLSQSDLREYTVKREDTWDTVTLHSRELAAQLIESCAPHTIDTSMLLSFNDQKMTPLHVAADAGDLFLLELFDSTFPDVWEVADKASENPLKSLMHTASLRGHEACVTFLTTRMKSCFQDEFSRVPAQVWHVSDVPKSLISWDEQYCMKSVPMDDTHSHGDPKILSSEGGIDVIDASEITAEQFEKYYLSVRKPVLVKGAVRSWPALQRWSTNYFASNYGNAEAWMGEIPYAPQFNLPGKKSTLLSYARYVSMVESNQMAELMKDKPIMYVFDNEVLSTPLGKGLFEDISIPELVQDYSWTVSQFMWGPPGSGAPMHHHQDAWNGLVFGEKRWFFFPPSSATSSTLILPQWESSYTCTQQPGDLVYVPDSWSHAIYNTKFTAAVALEFVYPK